MISGPGGKGAYLNILTIFFVLRFLNKYLNIHISVAEKWRKQEWSLQNNI